MDQPGAEAYILERLRHGLPVKRTYHSFAHTLDVYRTAVAIGNSEGVEGEELDLLRTAALYHDAGFLVSDTEHEMHSCRLAREALPGFGYTSTQIERVCAMVMATKVPQQPTDRLSRILCDADLDYLGRPDFHRIGSTLFSEFKHYGVLSTEREWNELQVRFLSQHRYFTNTSKRLREPAKQKHLDGVLAWLEEHKRAANG
jgi:uncharacterized protein